MDAGPPLEPPLEPDAVPERRPLPERRYTGRVVVVLADRVPLDDTGDLVEHGERNGDVLGPLVAYLRSNGVRTHRLVTGVALADLLRAEEEARDSPFPPLQSLARYWVVEAEGSGKGPLEVARELLGLEEGREPASRGVAQAYAETVVGDPGRQAVAPLTASTGQGWLAPRPRGVDAFHAWEQPGGRGEGVRVVDVEQGWELAHPDIDGLVGPPLVGVNRSTLDPAEGSHGTSVLGLVAGRVNGRGGSGLAGALAEVAVCSHFDGQADGDVVNAVLVAREHLSPGDVLLLEVDRPGDGYLCVETDDAVYAAVRLASAKGIVVVEAAGNGAEDLSAWTGPTGRRLSREDRDLDSGAILVGAAHGEVVTDPAGPVEGHRWNAGALSNYGERVDCYCWGGSVIAPLAVGYGSFGGTSAAAAIVAGVAAVVQGMQRAAGGPPLGPLDVRALLSHPGGTPQVPVASSFRIGRMPDLALIAGLLPVLSS